MTIQPAYNVTSNLLILCSGTAIMLLWYTSASLLRNDISKHAAPHPSACLLDVRETSMRLSPKLLVHLTDSVACHVDDHNRHALVDHENVYLSF